MAAMDPPSPFRFPHRESLQPLSPERVHNSRSRPASTISSKTASGDSDPYIDQPSPRPSPSRKAANLFSDYDSRRHSPVKETGFALPTSPSLPEIHAFQRSAHARTNSDVQGLVKRFEHLDVRDRDAEIAERRKRHEAELRRAQVAREEAESDVKRLREEVRRLKKEADEGRDRERKVTKRLDVVMDEFTTFKETQTSQLSIYEKEVRKVRKEAFKSSSAVLKLQEELKSTRNSLRITQSGFDMEKRKVQQREQQTFDAQYQMVALQEELERLKTHVCTVEQEKDALKTSLKEEEVARIAAEGMIALPLGNQDGDDLMSPRMVRSRSPLKRPQSPLSDDKENAGVVTKKMVEMKQVTEQLRQERTKREEAEEVAEFLRLECRFKCCGCRSRRIREHDMLLMSSPFAEALENVRSTMKSFISPITSESGEAGISDSAVSIKPQAETAPEVEIGIEDIEMVQPEQPTQEDGFERRMTMTGDEVDVDERARDAANEEAIMDDEEPTAPRPTPAEQLSRSSRATTPTVSTVKVPLAPSSPQTPGLIATPARPHGSIRTVTTTTTIPMQFTPAKPASHATDAESIPPTVISPQRDRSGSAPTFDRAAALAAIAYRRGRAKSIAEGHMTPRKQMLEGQVNIKERRDISAPALGQQKSATGKRTVSKSHTGKVGSASRTR